jgi:hypothetical protein
MHYFCTYFDHNYLSRGLALYRSLKQHCSSFKLWVLCMDRVCYDVLSKLGLRDVYLIDLEDFEKGDQELLRAKTNRTRLEYYFTCTPSLPLYIFNNHPAVDLITYLDADLFFFADPEPVYDEIADHSIAIIGHRFPTNLRDLERYGIYNVGWVSFRHDEIGLECIHWWRERCIEWCYEQCEGNRFADQKYLDNWPSLFRNVTVLQHKGANLAPWNLGNYKIRINGNGVWVDDQRLIFFHFHWLRQITAWLYDTGLSSYGVKISKVLRRHVYLPYLYALSKIDKEVAPLLGEILLNASLKNHKQIMVSGRRDVCAPYPVMEKLRRILYICRKLFARQCILVMNSGLRNR